MKVIIVSFIYLLSQILNVGISQFSLGPVIGYSALSITDDNRYGDTFLYTNERYSIRSINYGVVGKRSIKKYSFLARIMVGSINCDIRNQGFIPIKSFKMDNYLFAVLSEYHLTKTLSFGGGISLSIYRNLYETTSSSKVNHISDFISQKQLNLELIANYFWNNFQVSAEWRRTLSNLEDSNILRSFQTVSSLSINVTYLVKFDL